MDLLAIWVLPGFEETRMRAEAAKGRDLWRSERDVNGEEEEEEGSVGILEVLVWNFFNGLVLGFSQSVILLAAN